VRKWVKFPTTFGSTGAKYHRHSFDDGYGVHRTVTSLPIRRRVVRRGVSWALSSATKSVAIRTTSPYIYLYM
jgi:hypothetical protein